MDELPFVEDGGIHSLGGVIFTYSLPELEPLEDEELELDELLEDEELELDELLEDEELELDEQLEDEELELDELLEDEELELALNQA